MVQIKSEKTLRKNWETEEVEVEVQREERTCWSSCGDDRWELREREKVFQGWKMKLGELGFWFEETEEIRKFEKSETKKCPILNNETYMLTFQDEKTERAKKNSKLLNGIKFKLIGWKE